MDEWYNKLLKQLGLHSYPQETSSMLSRDIFYIGCRLNAFFQSAYQKPALTGLLLDQEDGKKLESSRATANHIKNQPANQLQTQVNQLRHQRVNLSLHKKGKNRKQSY